MRTLMAEATPTPEDPCPRCQAPVSIAATVCPFCRARVTVDVRVIMPLPEGRPRYQVARDVAALGPPAPDVRTAGELLQKRGAVLVRGATRLLAERVLGVLAATGAEAALEASRADPVAAVGRLVRTGGSRAGGVPGLLREHPLAAGGGALALLGGLALFFTLREAPDLTPAQIGKRAMPATALLKCKDSVGSGFFVTKELLITNAHVVCPGLKVQFGKKTLPGEVVKQDDAVDLALVRVAGARAPHLTLGDATTLSVGDPVVLLGSPQGLGESLQRGTVSHVGRGILGNVYVQIDASVNPGNSGGPLLDRKGHVVGVTTMATTSGRGIGFALPINYATHALAFVPGPSQRDWRGLSRPGVLQFEEWKARAEQEDAQEADAIRQSIDRPTLVAAVPGAQNETIAVLVQRSGWTPSTITRPFRVSRNGLRVCEGKLRVFRWVHPETDGGPEPVYIRWLRKHGLEDGLYMGFGAVGNGCRFDAVVGGEMVMEGEDGRDDRVSITPSGE
jgi:serine protease Do